MATVLVVKNLGSELHFYLNSWEKILLYCPPTWPPCHVVASQEEVVTKIQLF